MSQYYILKGPQKISNLRMDTLSQLLTTANIQSGRKYLVVEDVFGLVVSGIMERMSGFGEVVVLHENDTWLPKIPFEMNFDRSWFDSLHPLPWERLESDGSEGVFFLFF